MGISSPRAGIYFAGTNRVMQICAARSAAMGSRVRDGLYGHVADLSNGVTSGINASRRLDATFAIANPNPASPLLQPERQQEVSWTATRPTTRTMI